MNDRTPAKRGEKWLHALIAPSYVSGSVQCTEFVQNMKAYKKLSTFVGYYDQRTWQNGRIFDFTLALQT